VLAVGNHDEASGAHGAQQGLEGGTGLLRVRARGRARGRGRGERLCRAARAWRRERSFARPPKDTAASNASLGNQPSDEGSATHALTGGKGVEGVTASAASRAVRARAVRTRSCGVPCSSYRCSLVMVIAMVIVVVAAR
jgi:hypothetical protein